MLLTKDENIKTSSVYVGSLILKLFQKKRVNKLSIFEVSEHLRKYKIIHYRQVFFGLAFLYASNIVDFQEPFITLVSKDWERQVDARAKDYNQRLLFNEQ